MYVIEKNIPLPSKIIMNKREKYPFSLLKVGHSFLVPNGKMRTVSVSVAKYNKQMPNRRFTARTIKEGIRVWRVK